MNKSNAIPRAWVWFQGALKTVMGFVSQIPTLFINTLKSLELSDIILPIKAFGKVASVFGNFIVEFVSWAGQARADHLRRHPEAAVSPCCRERSCFTWCKAFPSELVPSLFAFEKIVEALDLPRDQVLPIPEVRDEACNE